MSSKLKIVAAATFAVISFSVAPTVVLAQGAGSGTGVGTKCKPGFKYNATRKMCVKPATGSY